MRLLTAWSHRLAAMPAAAAVLLLAGLLTPSSAVAETDTYACTGATQTSTTPSGASQATVTLNGAAGGGASDVSGGQGESLTFTLAVTAGEQFDVNAGCEGANGSQSLGGASSGAGGFDGGGNGTDGDVYLAAGGGGASDILPHGQTFTSLYGIAGGGGGAGGLAGFFSNAFNGSGGQGGNGESDGFDGILDSNPADSGLVSGGEGGFAGNVGGIGGAVGTNNGGVTGTAGTDGGALQGGRGGANSSWEGGGGGGGGGGWVGGGGGGLGGTGTIYGGGGGGGGGGQGLVQNGAVEVSNTDNAVSGDGSVIIDYATPTLAVTPTARSYGPVTVSQSVTETFTLSNSDAGTLYLGQASITGADADQFAIVPGQDTCSRQTLTTATCAIQVSYSPTSAGTQSATLSVPSNSYRNAQTTVALSGTGTAPAPPTTTNPAPAPPIVTAPTPPSTPSAPALVQRLMSVGTPTAAVLFTHGEPVRVSCNQACSVAISLMVYHRAPARGRKYRGLLHADTAVFPWTRVAVGHTAVTLARAGEQTVYVKVAKAPSGLLSYAGSILLGVQTTPAGGHAPHAKWVTIHSPDMNAKVAARKHVR
jgi:hypothetical protein